MGRNNKNDKRGKRYGRRNGDRRRSHRRRDKGEYRDAGHHRGDKDDKEKYKNQFILEFIEIIQDSFGRVVRTITKEHSIPRPFQTHSDRFVELTITSIWDGRDEKGKVVPSGTYSYIAFGRIVRSRSDWKKPGREHRSDRRRRRFRQSRYGKGAHEREVETISFPVVGTISVVQLGVAITSPLRGSVITTSTVLVEGEVDTPLGAEIGVTVNGVPAFVDQGRLAALVPVDLDVTSLIARVSDLSGTLLGSDAISVTVDPPISEPVLFFQPSPVVGSAPLAVDFTLTSLDPITQIDLDLEGDGTVDFQGTTLKGETFEYVNPGLYFPQVTVIDNLGGTHAATALVQVLDLTQLDALLQAKWTDMKDALRNGDVGLALTYISSRKRATIPHGASTILSTVISTQTSLA